MRLCLSVSIPISVPACLCLSLSSLCRCLFLMLYRERKRDRDRDCDSVLFYLFMHYVSLSACPRVTLFLSVPISVSVALSVCLSVCLWVSPSPYISLSLCGCVKQAISLALTYFRTKGYVRCEHASLRLLIFICYPRCISRLEAFMTCRRVR